MGLKTRVRPDPGGECPICGGATEIACEWHSPHSDFDWDMDPATREWRRCTNVQCFGFSPYPPEKWIRQANDPKQPTGYEPDHGWTFVDG